MPHDHDDDGHERWRIIDMIHHGSMSIWQCTNAQPSGLAFLFHYIRRNAGATTLFLLLNCRRITTMNSETLIGGRRKEPPSTGGNGQRPHCRVVYIIQHGGANQSPHPASVSTSYRYDHKVPTGQSRPLLVMTRCKHHTLDIPLVPVQDG